MALELYHDGVLTLPQVVDKCAHAPARLFGVRERGYLREGYWADLVLVDSMHTPPRSRGDALQMRLVATGGRHPAFEVTATVVNGELKYRDGEFFGGASGVRLEFDR